MAATKKTAKSTTLPASFVRDIKAAQKESRARKGVPYPWGVLRRN